MENKENFNVDENTSETQPTEQKKRGRKPKTEETVENVIEETTTPELESVVEEVVESKEEEKVVEEVKEVVKEKKVKAKSIKQTFQEMISGKDFILFQTGYLIGKSGDKIELDETTISINGIKYNYQGIEIKLV
jgi:hypothetical protein